MTDESTVPKFCNKTPKNLAGAKKEGDWPAYQICSAKPWALEISKNNGKVTEFFENDYKNFVAENNKRREDMRKKLRNIQSILSTAAVNPTTENVKEYYRKLADNESLMTYIEMESDGDYTVLIDTVDEWAEDEEMKQMDDKTRNVLIACVTEGLENDKNVQHSFISHTLEAEKATFPKKFGPNSFVFNATPKPTQIFVP